MSVILNLIFSALAVLIAAKLIPGVEVESFKVAILIAIVLAFINTFIKPIVKVLAFPINFMSLGLFSLLINGFLIMLADSLVDGFVVPNLIAALIFGFVLGVITSIFNFK